MGKIVYDPMFSGGSHELPDFEELKEAGDKITGALKGTGIRPEVEEGQQVQNKPLKERRYPNSPSLYGDQPKNEQRYPASPELTGDYSQLSPGRIVVLNHLTKKPVLDQRNYKGPDGFKRAVEMHPRELQHADLRDKDLSNISIADGNFSDSKMENVSFENAKSQRTNFDGASLWNCNFDNANLNNASFKNVKGLEYCSFKNANLKGANFTGSRLPDSADLQNADMTGAVMGEE